MRIVASIVTVVLFGSMIGLPVHAVAPASPEVPQGNCPTDAVKSLADAVRAGDCLHGANRLSDAVAAYRRGLQIDPKGSRDLYIGLSVTYLDANRVQSALEAALAADRISPNDPTVLVEVGMAYEDLRAYPESLDYFKRTVALRPGDGRAMRSVGFVLRQMKRPDEAQEYLEKAVQIDPNDWKAQYNLAGAYADIYRNGMRRNYELIMSMPHGGPATAPAYVEQAALVKKLNAGNYIPKAIEHSREAARLNPDDPELWYGHAHLLSEFPQRDESERFDAFKRAIALKPDYYAALHDLALAQTKSGRYAEAYETLDQLEKYHGDDRDIEWTRGDLDLATKRYEDAVRHYGSAIAHDPSEARLQFELARAYRKLGRTEESQQSLDRAKALRPDMAESYDRMLATD
ncbi:MAG TPA: tetratricopeptide repeat protein [Candidatus Polarisedimenticolaceae bacterium]|nr:tetratricopeptide repeat protein [Candidatus Polarisedimenticolaceae bacterium]